MRNNSFALRDSYSQRRGGAVASSLKFEFGPWTLIVLLFVAAVLMSFLYLTHFNQVATKGYDLKRLDAERQQLLGQDEIKSARLAEAKALTTMVSEGKFEGMRKPDHIVFARADVTIASR